MKKQLFPKNTKIVLVDLIDSKQRKRVAMGRKIRLKNHPDLAKAHESGAEVTLLQILTHAQYGDIGYKWTEFFLFEKHLAHESFLKLQQLHKAVLQLSPGTANIRIINDLDFLEDIYCAGTDMVSHACRTVQHLAESMQRLGRSELQSTTLEERIKESATQLAIDIRIAHPGYQGFIKISRTRDAIKHPKESNIFQGGDQRWDEVPLAWLISERRINAYLAYDSWLESLILD